MGLCASGGVKANEVFRVVIEDVVISIGRLKRTLSYLVCIISYNRARKCEKVERIRRTKVLEKDEK